jgi:predicted RNA binding protein YcfA (HicA-like mRNA interferase family)
VTPRLPVVSGAAVVQALLRTGFTEAGRRGSHLKLRNRDGRVVVVPLHDELARGTLSSVLRQAGLTIADLIVLLG